MTRLIRSWWWRHTHPSPVAAELEASMGRDPSGREL